MAGELKLHQLEFRAMGCRMQASVVTSDDLPARERLELVRSWMEVVEATLSRFQPQSELSRLNARPGLAVPVSGLLWDALTAALAAVRATGGVYDPTVLPALMAAGYDRTFAAGLDREELPVEMAGGLAGWREIECDPRTRSVTLPPGVKVDLGGMAKGWAAARAAGMLADLGPCLIDAGGDLEARGALPEQPGWRVDVADPHGGRQPAAEWWVRDRGVATSGIDHRYWRRGTVEVHHLIDPHRQRPAETDLCTATVVAPDAAQADLHALVVMVLGREAGLAYLAARPELDGLLIDSAGRHWTTPGTVNYRRF